MATTAFNADIGRQQFLQLLVSQLQYQNPLQPTDQEQILGQLAQFSVLDGIESMNLRFDDLLKLESLSQGANLVGKQVSYVDVSGAEKSGRVDEASVQGGELILKVNGATVPLSDVRSVLADAPAA